MPGCLFSLLRERGDNVLSRFLVELNHELLRFLAPHLDSRMQRISPSRLEVAGKPAFEVFSIRVRSIASNFLLLVAQPPLFGEIVEPELRNRGPFVRRIAISPAASPIRDDDLRFAARHHHPMQRSEEHTSELQSRQYLVCRL